MLGPQTQAARPYDLLSCCLSQYAASKTAQFLLI